MADPQQGTARSKEGNMLVKTARVRGRTTHNGAAIALSAETPKLVAWSAKLVAIATSSRVLRPASVVIAFAVWEAAARWFHLGLFLAPPAIIIGDLWDWISTGKIWPDLGTSLIEIAVAFPLAMVLGILLGLMVGFNQILRDLLEPTFTALYSTPLLALTPLFIVWLGIGIESKIALMLCVAVFPVIINTSVGVRQVHPDLIAVVRAFGGSKLDVIRYVRLPSAVPYITASAQIAVSRVIVAVFVAELFGARAGLGVSIQRAASQFDVPRMWSGIVVLATLGILGVGLVGRLERALTSWQGEEKDRTHV
jgi:ABC-type nitrate/sulfonate/bicarbonate transport system permease component